MSVTWHRAPAQARLHCGYCGYTRELTEGEIYARLVSRGTGRPFVRCAECARTRWGLTPPETVAEAVMSPVRHAEPAPSWERVSTVRGRVRVPVDVKARASGDV